MLLFGAGSAGAARAHPSAAVAVFSIRGLIADLAADGNLVAVATSQKGNCGKIVVWTAPGRKWTSFAAMACATRSCNICMAKMALGAEQVAWGTLSVGNGQDLGVTAVKLSGGKPKGLDSVYNHDGADQDPNGSYFGPLFGAGTLLAYNQWTICIPSGDPYDPPCPVVDPATHRVLAKDEIKLISAAGKIVVAKLGAGSYGLAAVGGGRLAVRSAGSITLLAPSGAPLATVPAVQGDAPRAIELSGTSLGVERKSKLDLYDAETGASTNSLPLGTAATLLLGGVNSKLALLRSVRRLVLIRLSDGRPKALSLPKGTTSIVDARLTEAGLFYAYNVPKASAKGRIVFERTANLLARF